MHRFTRRQLLGGTALLGVGLKTPLGQTGIFDQNNSKNPVRDWNMIYVPYCTGDIHGGDTDHVLGGQMRHFHGYANITKYLERWVPTFPSADKVLLNGSMSPPIKEMRVGERYRLRLVDIHTFRPSMIARVVKDSTPVTWRFSPVSAATPVPSRTSTPWARCSAS